MKTIMLTGRLTRDAESRQAGSDTVTRFSLAVDDRKGQERGTLYFDCDIWGKRGSSLQPSLRKGTSVAVCGEFSTREHNGKTYMTVRVDTFDFTGSKPADGGGEKRDTSSGGSDQSGYGAGGRPMGNSRNPIDDEIPFNFEARA